MSLKKVCVRRMSTSREDHTKYEHFVVLINTEGETFDLYMRHKPEEALYLAMEFAQVADIPCDDLIIDGVKIELDAVLQLMLDNR